MPTITGRLRDEATQAHEFIVAGISLRKAGRVLKPSFPKKRQADSARIVLSVLPGKVTMALPGASFGMPALASGEFTVEVPFLHMKPAITEPLEQGAIVAFAFGQGSMDFLGIEMQSPEIRLQRGVPVDDDSRLFEDTPIANPEDACAHLPLLAAFALAKRKQGFGAPADTNLLHQKQELDKILKRADKLLAPLGIGRYEIETILTKRIGGPGGR